MTFPTLSHYENKALLYAEQYGITSYNVIDNSMTYEESFPNEGTYKCIVNLDTLTEVRTKVK